MTIDIPANAASEQPIGIRLGLSNQDDMPPYGEISSDDVEDYLVLIECKTCVFTN